VRSCGGHGSGTIDDEAHRRPLPTVLDQAQAEKLTLTAALERLLAIEVDATEARRLAGRLRFASLPTPATLDDFDYDAQPGVDLNRTGFDVCSDVSRNWWSWLILDFMSAPQGETCPGDTHQSSVARSSTC